MELDTLRSIITTIGLLCFVAIAIWAYSKPAGRRFEEAAQLPFKDEEHDYLRDVETGTQA